MKQRNELHCDADIWTIFMRQTHIIYIYYLYIYIQEHFSKWTDHAIDFKWSIYGGGLRDLEYHYDGIVWDPYKGIDISRKGSGRCVELID